MIHPRLSVNAMCSFSWSWDQDFVLWKSLGLRHAGLLISKLGPDAGAKLSDLSAAGISISTLITGGFDLSNRDSWEATHAAHRHAIDLVATEKGRSIYFTSGRTVRLDWDEDFALLAEAVAPSVAYGREKGVLVALEPSQRTSVSFVTTLADAIDVAQQTGLSIVADFANCWAERGLAASFKRAAPHLALLQIDDIIIGSTNRPAPGGRAHIGIGELPVRRMVQDVLDAGYTGPFDLEVVPADFTAATDEAELRAGVEAASALLYELGID
jgi:sugar phosphate isomerase/epimerase